MQKKLILLFLLFASVAYAQKKPLDHSVYDTWESVGAKQFTNNGLWAAYAVNQQEGDANLYFQETLTAKKSKFLGQVLHSSVQILNSLLLPLNLGTKTPEWLRSKRKNQTI
ncbi:hypothetical protein [Pedobacter sp. UC225_65]|uniref:hypothetical protein n=1 Tax=Pedobacter sp. UC225_65 TaxID=3350173 RepID=UPI0036731E5B